MRKFEIAKWFEERQMEYDKDQKLSNMSGRSCHWRYEHTVWNFQGIGFCYQRVGFYFQRIGFYYQCVSF